MPRRNNAQLTPPSRKAALSTTPGPGATPQTASAVRLCSPHWIVIEACLILSSTIKPKPSPPPCARTRARSGSLEDRVKNSIWNLDLETETLGARSRDRVDRYIKCRVFVDVENQNEHQNQNQKLWIFSEVQKLNIIYYN